MSIIVVGTDTEVGKTVTCGVLLSRYAKSSRLAYWKPVASGADAGPSDRELVARWLGSQIDVLPETYSFGPPVSPHLAARLAGARVDSERILSELVAHGIANELRNLVIEGVGGVLVPLDDHGYLLADLLREACLPVLIVARSTLGTINHGLLTIEALRSRHIDIAGVVLSGPRNAENRAAIERFGRVEIIDEIEPISRVGPKSIAAAAAVFDRRGRLAEYFE